MNFVWRYHNPVRIEFGQGAFDQLGTLIGKQAYGLVTYPDAFCGLLTQRLVDLADSPSIVISDIAPNPDYPLLDSQVRRIRENGSSPTIWVALGGGSVIDSTKVFAAANGDFAAVANKLESGSTTAIGPAVPIIAVPTTAGTGSEVTCWATVWNQTAGKKYSLAQADLYPRVAVVDPELMIGMPRALTINTGLDALSHALESLWNVNANPVSANHAVFAAREILGKLPELSNDLTNTGLRERMARAATFAGLAFSNTKTAIAHSLSYPITLKHKVPHGIACSFSLPIVAESVRGRRGICGEALARIFGNEGNGPAMLTEFLNRLGVSANPADHGVAADEWLGLVDDAFDGERGRNFIGDKDRFLHAAQTIGALAG
ncbi:MAG: phosphonoacetaldehyde reductase [Hyphomicrobiales bacterium]|nr:phosphonoacetaldehyde reductase [Hyphomicrobiales bacterium]MCP4999297.1 phosphonoacetaldehyde reductase [Hyphomicrobiales bacterium]